MKYLIIAALAVIFAQLGFPKPLSAYKWKNRVIVIKGQPKTKAYRDSLKRLQESQMKLRERDVVILEEKSPDFEILLYGKDGGQKWKSGEDFKVEEITSLIDSMPMRQAEMEARD